MDPIDNDMAEGITGENVIFSIDPDYFFYGTLTATVLILLITALYSYRTIERAEITSNREYFSKHGRHRPLSITWAKALFFFLSAAISATLIDLCLVFLTVWHFQKITEAVTYLSVLLWLPLIPSILLIGLLQYPGRWLVKALITQRVAVNRMSIARYWARYWAQ